MAAQVTSFSGTLPSRTSGQTTTQFNTNANDLFVWLTGNLVTDINTLATEAETDASTAETKATEAATSATNAATSATNAATSATTAEGYKDTAVTAAAAAQAAAGLPSLSGNAGKALAVNTGETGVEWTDSFLQYQLISTETISSSVSAVDIALPSGYSKLILEFFEVDVSSDAYMTIQTSTDGGSTFDSGGTDYSYMTITESTGAAIGNVKSANNSYISCTAYGSTHNGRIEIYNYDDAEYTEFVAHMSARESGGHLRIGIATATRKDATAIDYIRISKSTIDSGVIKLYGVK